METIVNRYMSMDAYLRSVETCAPSLRWARRRPGWSKPDLAACADARQGASEAAQKPVKDILSKIDATMNSRTRREIIPTVAGGMVNVPDFLQGKPRCMRRRQDVESELAPVRVVVEIGVSDGTSTEAIVRRGAAVAALVMRLAETRAVELHTLTAWCPRNSCGMQKTVITTARVNTSPISLSEITAYLVNQDFARSITFTETLRACGLPFAYYDSMAWGWEMYDPAPRMRRIRAELGLVEQDILVPGGILDEADEIICDPVAWVNKYLDPQREL